MASGDQFPHLTFTSADHQVLVIRVTSDRFELDEAQSLLRLVFESSSGLAPNILLNFAGVKYLNSTGVSLLVRIGTERALRVVNLNPSVVKVLDSIGILALLKIHRSEREAMEAFAKA